MSEDSVTPDSGQDPHSTQSPVNLTEALFGPHLDQCWVTAGVAGNKPTWTGHFYKRDRVEAFDPMHGHYFSIALIRKGSVSRSAFDGGIVIVADDIGHTIPDGFSSVAPGAEVDLKDFEMFAPETSYEVETSPGNFQMGYRISPVEKDYARWHHFIERMKRHELFGKAFEKCTGVHYARMETGSNQPKPNRPRFKSKLAKPYTGLTYTLDELADLFGIDMSRPSASTRVASGEQLPPVAVKKLLEMLPNDAKADYGYDVWVKIGHAIYGATNGSLEGLNLYDWWSAQSPRYGLTETPDRKWDSFYNAGASASTLRVLIEEKWGPDSKERKQASQIFAQDAFGEVQDAAGIDAAETEKIERKLDELLTEIRKTQKVPDQHRSGDDKHWAKNGKVQTLREAAVSIVAPPVIVTPYERGVMSVLGGMPGLGKSLLILQQGLAITYNRPDLIRHGHGKLNFAGDVIYISNEDGLGLMKRRYRAWAKRHGLENDVPPYEVIPLKSTLMHRDGSGWQHECLAILEMILDWVRQGRDIAMIVVDTLATSVTGVDENAVKDMAPVMSFLDGLSKVFWASVVFVHHINKGAVADEDRSIVGLRGSISISGAVRGAVTLSPPTKKEIEEFGWQGRDVICEYIAKANDDRARYTACFYELVTEDIEVGDAVDPTRLATQPTPVLVPTIPIKAIDDLDTLKGWFGAIETALGNGNTVRVYADNARNTGVNSAHRALGVSVKKAAEIVSRLREMGWIIVTEGWDESNHKGMMVGLPEGSK